MSGHSKWSKVKHQKAVTDVVRGKNFTKSAHAITVAVQEGGGVTDPTSNFRLRLAIEKARAVNVPKENIERAIEKGKGNAAGGLSTMLYEAYGPGGAGILIEAVTDNKQRTVSFIKNLLDRNGGTLATQGAVAYQFDRRGQILIHSTLSADDILAVALESGALDILTEDDRTYLITEVGNLESVKNVLGQHTNVTVDTVEIVYLSKIPVPLTEEVGQKLSELVEALEDQDDVHHIYTNAV